jgi:hypothetical protein
MPFSSRLPIVAKNYSTYIDERTGERERHLARVVLQAVLALSLSIVTADLSDNSISAFITSLSIVVGFAFTALFPITADPDSGMPPPKFSEDWDNLTTIWTLVGNFRTNVQYFVPLSLIAISILALQMLEFKMPAGLQRLVEHYNIMSCGDPHGACIPADFVMLIVRSISFFLLQEVGYTFYRLCFNALALLRIKEQYKKERFEADRRDVV